MVRWRLCRGGEREFGPSFVFLLVYVVFTCQLTRLYIPGFDAYTRAPHFYKIRLFYSWRYVASHKSVSAELAVCQTDTDRQTLDTSNIKDATISLQSVVPEFLLFFLFHGTQRVGRVRIFGKVGLTLFPLLAFTQLSLGAFIVSCNLIHIFLSVPVTSPYSQKSVPSGHLT